MCHTNKSNNDLDIYYVVKFNANYIEGIANVNTVTVKRAESQVSATSGRYMQVAVPKETWYVAY